MSSVSIYLASVRPILRSGRQLSDAHMQALGRRALRVAGRQGSFEASVRFVGAKEMTSLNGEHRGIGAPTDVLSFPQGESSDPTVKFPDVGEATQLGDIVICTPYVREQARRKGRRMADELAWVFVHGLFHLLGEDHQNKEEEARMRGMEREVLGKSFPDADDFAIVES